MAERLVGRKWVALAVVAGLVLSIVAVHTAAAAARPDHGTPVIRVLGNRADLVHGGDALIEVTVPGSVGAQTPKVRVRLNGEDVTDAFSVQPGGELLGLIDGLEVGDNVVTASTRGVTASLDVTNHPQSGPTIAGPHLEPFICRSPPACEEPRRVEYYYRSTRSGLYEPLSDPSAPPPDAKHVQSPDGRTIPHIVRIEFVTLNRARAAIAVPWDPEAGDWTFSSPHGTWNDKLIYRFRPGCGTKYEQGGQTAQDMLPGLFQAAYVTGSALAPSTYERGFAVISTSLNNFGLKCEDLISAETTIVAKEYFVERYGPPLYTMGWGESGGSVQQHMIADNYPGLLDGIVPAYSVPDVWSSAVFIIADCHLLHNYFRRSQQLWSIPAQQNAVTGKQDPSVCALASSLLSVLLVPHRGDFDQSACDPVPALPPNAALACGAVSPLVPTDGNRDAGPSDCFAVPSKEVYDPETNPDGVRCTLQDLAVNVFGRRPDDGFARRPYDNIGIQYGLGALIAGTITPEQFVDLNESVGGLDIDGNLVAQRSRSDDEAVRIAHSTGRVVTFGQGLADIPILQFRFSPDPGRIHEEFQSDVARARLERSNGHANNFVEWDSSFANESSLRDEALDAMDRWMTALANDDSDASPAEKVVRAKPTDVVDSCWLPGSVQVTDLTVCRAVFPHYSDSRIVAGGPPTNDVLKCRLQPLERSAYPVIFTDEQWARLREAFPEGVCDYAQPGVHQDLPQQTWVSFANGPGGEALPPPPVSGPISPRSAAGTR